jgi:two-component system response regulator AtoC
LQKINLELCTNVAKLQSGVMDCLMEHPWSGNVREMENVLVEAVIRVRGNVILLDVIEKILNKNRSGAGESLTTYSLPQVEKEHIQNTLSHVAWNRTKAAQMLGISLPTLRSKIRKYGIAPSENMA